MELGKKKQVQLRALIKRTSSRNPILFFFPPESTLRVWLCILGFVLGALLISVAIKLIYFSLNEA
jgi:hypothetical protein